MRTSLQDPSSKNQPPINYFSPVPLHKRVMNAALYFPQLLGLGGDKSQPPHVEATLYGRDYNEQNLLELKRKLLQDGNGDEKTTLKAEISLLENRLKEKKEIGHTVISVLIPEAYNSQLGILLDFYKGINQDSSEFNLLNFAKNRLKKFTDAANITDFNKIPPLSASEIPYNIFNYSAINADFKSFVAKEVDLQEEQSATNKDGEEIKINTDSLKQLKHQIDSIIRNLNRRNFPKKKEEAKKAE